MKHLASFLMLGVAIVAMPALAQQQRGDVELQFQGYYFTTVGTDFTFGSGSLAAKIGPYLTNNLQIGIGPTLTVTTATEYNTTFDPNTFEIVTTTDTKTTTTFGTTAFFVYSFLMRNAKVVPYFGAQYFKQDFSNSDDKGSVGMNAGVKFYFSRKTAVDVSGNYLFTLNKDQEGGMLLFAVGLSFLL